VIDPSTGRLKYTLGADYAILTTAAAPSPDGTKLAATTAGALVILADLGTGTLRRPQAVHDAPVTTLAFARGGRSLISGDDAGKVRLWKLPECELARAFDDCESQACVAMSTETSKCASGGKTIQLRGLWTGQGQRALWVIWVDLRPA